MTHALRLPVYRLFSQSPCRRNDQLRGTGLLAQVLEGNPCVEVWECERRGRSRTLAHRDVSGEMEATVYSTDWLHPGAQGDARAGTTSLPGIALAAGACGAEVGTTHTAPSPKGQAPLAWKRSLFCLLSSPISGCPVFQAPFGTGIGEKHPKRVPKGWEGRGRRKPQVLAVCP